jgi:hypothetical protein
MARHQLFLEFPETTNEGIIRIEDSSIYNSAIPINCITLEITPPGYATPTVITGLSPYFKLFLNACDLGILLPGACADVCPVLPEGIYNVRYSISPNDKVWVEYKIMRVVSTKQKWYKTLCWINDRPCSPVNDQLVLIRELQLISNQIDSAVGFVEDLHEYQTGMDMFRYARKKLIEISRGCNNCQ